ncbi:probable pyruvate dehydrogenase E1 component subunit alpha, mitochondrial [Diabrotica virgifera virgifera]|uniref:Pyruvate dehydrogenase E1 component subunit alpha n=1 Tax=Diabrotica virgifera virgifera TaxID=50390 RepID=A0A6P7GX80_DIAVI|nr:probable pyruvate dehydrogenase E1 component subunit alpha, mitochondrial [Diabrotica virgifera virgifera]
MNILHRNSLFFAIRGFCRKYSSASSEPAAKTVLHTSRTYSGDTPVKTSGELHLTSSHYDLYRLDKGPSTVSEVTREECLRMYRDMLIMRRMEIVAANMYLKKEVRGFCHVYVGQEACAVGIHSVMRPHDTSITSYRCHGWAYLVGESVENIFAELLGKVTGSARGKGGSIHIYGKRFYGGNGIVGAQIPLGAGLALAHKYNNDGAICFSVMGDGAVDQGQVYEAYNFAKLHDLPVVFIIENNQYSMGTSTKRHSANIDYYTRGDVIPGVRVGGMDILAVREAGKFAIDHINKGNGPIILQLDTYRYYGHSMSDPGTTYRTRDEVRLMRESQDCIKGFQDKLVSTKEVTDEQLKKMEKEVKLEIDEALKRAMAAPAPAVEETYYDIYRDYSDKVKMPAWGAFTQHKNVSHLIQKEEEKIDIKKSDKSKQNKKKGSK